MSLDLVLDRPADLVLAGDSAVVIALVAGFSARWRAR
jgi:hypothetical protein